ATEVDDATFALGNDLLGQDKDVTIGDPGSLPPCRIHDKAGQIMAGLDLGQGAQTDDFDSLRGTRREWARHRNALDGGNPVAPALWPGYPFRPLGTAGPAPMPVIRIPAEVVL